MIKTYSSSYLTQDSETKELYVVTIKETYFLGMTIKYEEHSDYDITLIKKYLNEEPVKSNKIGFKYPTKKKKKNENKSKIS